MAAKSTVAELPAPVLAEVHAAIGRGEKIDDIVAIIQSLGADRSRSSVGRYTKQFQELARQQRNMQSVAEAFGNEFGNADDRQGRMMVQMLTSVITRAIIPLAGDAEPEMGAKELKFLAGAVKDAVSATKIDVEREAKVRDEAAKRAKADAANAADSAGRAAGASEETLRKIRAGILGIAA